MYYFICFALLALASRSAQAQFYRSGSPQCQEVENGYVPIDGNCDSFIECQDFVAKETQCPDGLHFDLNAQWPEYPCGYPQDVSCKDRSIIQSAQPTAECPHQYGFFPAARDSIDCGRYHMCIEGVAWEMTCPPGLAFDPDLLRCDWPENIPSCNANGFLGFTCPAARFDISGNPVVTNHKHNGECHTFFSCVNGNARLLSCDPGYAFEDSVGRCVDADRVQC